MTRAFVAVRPPDAVLDAVEAATVGLSGPDRRRTPRAQWHFTLQFLGNAVNLDAVGAALQALDAPAGAVQLGGGGAFPTARRATVLWLGVRDGHAMLTDLATRIGLLLAPLGYEPDARRFRPHLTLARTKTPTDLRDAVAALGSEAMGPSWTVTEVTLYESVLGRDGAQHFPRCEVTLR